MHSKSLFLGVLSGAAPGLGLAYAASRQHGYVAGLMPLFAAVIGIAALILAAILALPRRTRSTALAAAVAAPTILVTCYVSIVVMASHGVWETGMQSFGPDQTAGLVVLFEQAADDQEIFHFVETVLGRPHPHGKGTDLAPGVSSLLLVHVHGHKGYAVGFRPGVSPAQRAALRQEIEADPIVWRTFADTAPTAIQLD
jgi:uncharacterized membrane protein (GlpM family)